MSSHKGCGRVVNYITAPVIAEKWKNGATMAELDREFGGTNVVANARQLIGVDLIPIRPAHPKMAKKKKTFITSTDIGRHLVRRLSKQEYLVRDEHGREEIWKTEEHGIKFHGQAVLSFVIVMGMTERRIPEDLKHIYQK